MGDIHRFRADWRVLVPAQLVKTLLSEDYDRNQQTREKSMQKALRNVAALHVTQES